jgi:hypothetical protein
MACAYSSCLVLKNLNICKRVVFQWFWFRFLLYQNTSFIILFFCQFQQKNGSLSPSHKNLINLNLWINIANRRNLCRPNIETTIKLVTKVVITSGSYQGSIKLVLPWVVIKYQPCRILDTNVRLNIKGAFTLGVKDSSVESPNTMLVI